MTKESWSDLKLSIYIGEKDNYEGKPLYKFIVHKLKEMGVIGVTVFRGIYGYGRKSHIHSSHTIELSTNLPILIETIDEGNKIQKAFEELKKYIKEGLAIIEPVTVVFITPDKEK